MSWEDDDFDVEEDFEQQKQANSELTVDDLEEIERKKKEAELAAAPKAKKKVKKKDDEKIDPEDCAYDVALEDPVAEKLRRQKLVEEADARMAADLFSGVSRAEEDIAEQKAKEEAAKAKAAAKIAKKEAPKVQIEVRDAFDKVHLATQSDVEALLATCMEKIENSKAKGAAQMFLTQALKALEAQLSSEELTALDKQVTGIVKAKKVEKTAADDAKRKTNEKMSKNTKFDTGKEIADVYGAGEWGDDWDEEEWYDEGSKPATSTAATGAKW